MIEVNVLNLRAMGRFEQERINKTINNLATFQLQFEKLTSSLNEQFSYFKELFIDKVLQFKNGFLQKQAMHTGGSTTEKLFHQMENEISFLHDELKSKNTDKFFIGNLN